MTASNHSFSPYLIRTKTLLFTITISLVLLSTLINAHSYTYLSYAEITSRLQSLSSQYPNLIRLYSAQDRFSLPHVGNCSELASETNSTTVSTPCSIWVVEFTNHDTLPSDPGRPELLISGELHGDEVVGPNVVIAFMEYLVKSYETDPFIKTLIDSRAITLVPMTNAIGYHGNTREEIQVPGTTSYDPNRDFGFNQSPEKCMQTVAARALNELFRVHLYRILITFHGGTNVIGYEWGDNSHCRGPVCKPAPDTALMKILGERMSKNAGSAGIYEAKYPVGNMGKLVYPVNGGLEDWAYGASWAKEATTCKPTTLNGYPESRTEHDSATLRCVTYLIETAREKRPPESTLGWNHDLFKRGSQGDGHIPRNIRLLLTVLDAVEPFILVDETVKVGDHRRPIVNWEVSGAFQVDGTMLQWSTENGTDAGWGIVKNGSAGAPVAGGEPTLFTETAPGKYPMTDKPLYYRIAAVVDHALGAKYPGADPDVMPQSHLMGSRASNTWKFSNGNKQLIGSKVWFSKTWKLELTGDGQVLHTVVPDAKWGARGDGNLATVSDEDLVSELLKGTAIPEFHLQPSPKSTTAGAGSIILFAAVGVMSIISVALIIFLIVRRRRKSKYRIGNFSIDNDDEELEEQRALTPQEEDIEAAVVHSDQ